MRTSVHSYWLVLGLLMTVSGQPAWGFFNNGFDTDSIYTLKATSTAGQLSRRAESNPGGNLGDLLPSSPYVSLTFSGQSNNDARLWVLAPNGTTDLNIVELNASGGIVQQKSLSTLLGAQPGFGQGFTGGTDSGIGNIRYNRYHNSLVVSGNPNVDPSTSKSGMAWEIDLGLTQILHTYVGPLATDRPFQTGFNERTGELYMIGRSNQDVVSFDTSSRAVGGTTNSFTKLVDHNTIGIAGWIAPKCPIYRDARLLTNGLPSNDDTLVTLVNNANNSNQYEFYLNTSNHPLDGNGNLIRRGTSPINGWNAWNGQQDEISGHVWFGNIASGGTNGGFSVIRADDTTGRFFTGTGFYDIDSPIPEPATLGLLGFGVLAMLHRPRKSIA